MKVIVNTKYGPADVLQLKEVENLVPRRMKHEALIRIYWATENATGGETTASTGNWLQRLAERDEKQSSHLAELLRVAEYWLTSLPEL